jgi:hypothetical protein
VLGRKLTACGGGGGGDSSAEVAAAGASDTLLLQSSQSPGLKKCPGVSPSRGRVLPGGGEARRCGNASVFADGRTT